MNVFEKSHIRETLNLLTDADSSTNTKTNRIEPKGYLKNGKVQELPFSS